ncbi:MAG: zinc-binding dehydrogenase [Burkholderiales bacterium]|nr:zinc-binding dehydrogenase [Burkholderiales bacterium]
MQAVQVVAGADAGRVEVREVSTPSAGPGQVLVRVRTAGVNRGEINQVRRYKTGAPLPAGVEFAGTVAAVGPGVSAWREGDPVMGHGAGGQAEYVLANPLALMAAPRGLPWLEAAAFPNVFMTAHDALITNGQLQAGESVLVNAASSGIGLAAIQIAALCGAGAVLATTRSAAKAARLAEFGVTRAIDVSREDQVAAVRDATGGRGVDVIVDSVGGTVFEANLQSLAVLGRLVNIGRLGSSESRIDLEALWMKRLKLIGVTFRTRSEAERLAVVQACARDLLPFLAAGRIKLPIDRAFAMHDIAQAHAYMQEDRHFGKIVLVVDPECTAAGATT